MRRRRDSKADRRGLIILGVTAAIAVTMIGLSVATRDKGRYNDKTLCPLDRPYARTAVIVDKTDRLTPAQAQFLKSEVLRIRDGMRTFEKLSIYVLNEANGPASAPEFELCNPGSGADANELYQNPRKLKRRFEERFGKPLDAVVENLLVGEKANSTPLMEMIQSVAFAEKLGEGGATRKLLLISDMLQHSQVYSQYREKLDFAHFKSGELYRRVAAPLTGVDVRVIYFQRNGQARRQNAGHIQFWEEYFSSMGATLSEIRYGP